MILTLNNNSFALKHCIAVAIFVFLSSPLHTNAQESLVLSVSPTLFEMSANPGHLWQSSVKVINSNSYDLTVYASVVNFAPQGETGQGKFLPVFEEMTEGASLAEWVDINARPIVIEKEQSAEIPFTVIVPDDASPGGHFAAILFSTQPPESVGGEMQVRTAQIVTSLFFVRISGDVNESGTIRSFTTVDTFHQKPETVFELRFENKGNVHLQPRGDIRIFNMWGKERGVIPINHRTHFGNVLPESIRKFDFTWEGEQSITDIGRYKAIATLAYGLGEKKFVTGSTHFWVVPLKSLTITLGSLLAFVFLVIWVIRLYVRRMLQMAGIDPVLNRERNNAARAIPESEGDVRIASYKNLSAPMRHGYLDLRARLKDARAFLGVLRTLVSFVVSYKRFFIGVLIIVAALLGLYYYIDDVTNVEKEYNVTISNPDVDLNLSSEEIAYADIAKNENLPELGLLENQVYTLSVINTSGVSGSGATKAAVLIRSGYGVSELKTGSGRLDKRSIVVFDTQMQEQAVELSKLLDGALLSARTGSSTEALPNITLYIGADQAVD
jgi:hypothetical protein